MAQWHYEDEYGEDKSWNEQIKEQEEKEREQEEWAEQREEELREWYGDTVYNTIKEKHKEINI